MNEFAHHGADNQFRRLAGSSQAFAKTLAPTGFVQGHHGRHIQRLAQEGMADLGHARLALDAAAGLVLARVEAGKAE